MKKILIACIIPLLFACSAKESEKDVNKAEQLKNYKTELSALKAKISDLELEIRNTNQDEEKINVVVKKLTTSKFEHYIQITGNVEADKNITITPETGGNIISINVVEGQKVNKGDILGTLNTSQIQQQIDEIKTNLELSSILFERQERLWNQKIGSEVEYLEAKAKKEALENNLAALNAQKEMAIITAPFSGIVDEIHQKKGEMAGPSTPLAQLVNINRVYVEGDVSETFLNAIKAGGNAQLDFPAINFQTKAKINRTSNVINPANRSFKIRINLNNANHMIKPNLISVMKIKDYEVLDAMVVPSIIIKKDFKGNYLYIAKKENGKMLAEKVYVDVSKTYNNLSMIESGLTLGDLIITEGFSQVVNGALISTK
ncbi:efflux RND transporter periplasmic adaptor subunit [Labilibaculum sp. DW002]|uniref:Efflux RND transporter periplasmic adaptor subunit n=1 Tax=Paralabilibaculum antarcticum TaxID=2912572 RepID=A0ABT5VWY0_9BACT|nr:efflux RND transporter periplasmic adaptor subunit [Labilibaculum sp. DW002]MDE5419917.1 efflux RND transporter periplasmic adaptor subunit [Labilibaculum sp. DW002]